MQREQSVEIFRNGAVIADYEISFQKKACFSGRSKAMELFLRTACKRGNRAEKKGKARSILLVQAGHCGQEWSRFGANALPARAAAGFSRKKPQRELHAMGTVQRQSA